MQRYFVVTGTITYALKGRNVLKSNGYNAEIRKLMNKEENSGCGYGISVIGEPEDIKQILAKNGVKILKIKSD